eukprot:scaffold19715_cov54-Attheya_sp.AAC.6
MQKKTQGFSGVRKKVECDIKVTSSFTAACNRRLTPRTGTGTGTGRLSHVRLHTVVEHGDEKSARAANRCKSAVLKHKSTLFFSPAEWKHRH